MAISSAVLIVGITALGIVLYEIEKFLLGVADRVEKHAALLVHKAGRFLVSAWYLGTDALKSLVKSACQLEESLMR